MVKKVLTAVPKNGWKGYAAGVGLMLYGIVIGIDALGIDIGGLEGSMENAIETFLLGLAAFGIRSKQDRYR